MSAAQPRRVGVLIETLHPKDTNPEGKIFGGILMSIMDKAAGVAAWSYAKCRVVTACAEGITFHTPILVGEVVKATATVVCTGRSSMEIEVVVEVENLMAETCRIGVTGFFTMVALDSADRPAPVPMWQPQTVADRQRQQLALARRQQRQEQTAPLQA